MIFEETGDGKFSVQVTPDDMAEFREDLIAQGFKPIDMSGDDMQEKFFEWCRNKRDGRGADDSV